MQRLLGLCLLGFSMCYGQNNDAESRLANISVALSSTFGEPIGKVVVILTGVSPSGQFQQLGQNTVHFEGVPFGLYDIQVSAAGFTTLRSRVDIYQREVKLQLGLPVSEIHSKERPEIEGHVRAEGIDHSALWVRLVPRYSAQIIEDQVSAGGTFHLAGMTPGRYVLLVFVGETLALAKPVEVLGRKITLDISLPK